MRGDVIPRDSMIVKAFAIVDVALTGNAGATIALNAESAGDLLAALVFGSWPAANAGKDLIPDFTAANFKRTTDNRPIQATIATATITGGKFRVYVVWVPIRA